MLSAAFTRKLMSALEVDSYIPEDFSFDSSNNEEGFLVIKITYRYDNEFFIEFSHTGRTYEVVMVPGEIYRNQYQKISDNFETMWDTVREWVQLLDEELSSSPLVRRLDEIDEKISTFQDLFDDSAGDTFDAQEILDLKERLNDLEKKLEDEIINNRIQDENTDQEIKSLKETINSLKTQSETLSKKNWLLSLTTKLYMISNKYPKIAGSIGIATYEILPESIKESTKEIKDYLLPKSTQ